MNAPQPPTTGLALTAWPLQDIQSLAHDVVLYGGQDLEGVLRAHNLTPELLATFAEVNPAFRAEVDRLRKQAEADPHFLIRTKAREALNEVMPELAALARGAEYAADRLKAIDQIATLADAKPRPEKVAGAGTGVVVHLNLGPGAPTIVEAP